MTTIQLTSLKGQTKEMILQYLQSTSPSFYNVVVPKTGTPDDNHYGVFNDFMMADHLVNRLREISYDVLFGVPEPGKVGVFDFIVLTDDLDALARLLDVYANGFEGEVPGQDLEELILDETIDWPWEARPIPYFYNVCARVLGPDADFSMNAYALDSTY